MYRDNPQTSVELKEAIGKEIRCIDSEVTKTVFDNMKKRPQVCIKSGGHQLKTFVFRKL